MFDVVAVCKNMPCSVDALISVDGLVLLLVEILERFGYRRPTFLLYVVTTVRGTLGCTCVHKVVVCAEGSIIYLLTTDLHVL